MAQEEFQKRRNENWNRKKVAVAWGWGDEIRAETERNEFDIKVKDTFLYFWRRGLSDKKSRNHKSERKNGSLLLCANFSLKPRAWNRKKTRDSFWKSTWRDRKVSYLVSERDFVAAAEVRHCWRNELAAVMMTPMGWDLRRSTIPQDRHVAVSERTEFVRALKKFLGSLIFEGVGPMRGHKMNTNWEKIFYEKW